MCLKSFVFFLYAVQPPSASVLLGQDATFSCAGEAFAIIWTINDIVVQDLGLEPTDDLVDSVRISNLTITGSLKNNNVSIKCLFIMSDASSKTSPSVLLTLLGKSSTVPCKTVCACLLFSMCYSETCIGRSPLGPDQLAIIQRWPACKDCIEIS